MLALHPYRLPWIFFYNVVQPYFPNILPNLSAVSNYTFSMLSLLVAFMMVYQEMGSLKHRNYQVVGGLTGICAYILAMKGTTVDGVYSVTWNRFGPTGIVVAICIGLYVSIIFHLIAKLNLFKNNNTIPEFVQEWIKNIIPIFLSILLLKIVIIDLDVDLYPIVLKLFGTHQCHCTDLSGLHPAQPVLLLLLFSGHLWLDLVWPPQRHLHPRTGC